MLVIFKTNIDHYKTNCFPKNLVIPPRIGETVSVTDTFESHFRDKRLPTRLEVVDVIWTEDGVVCELWYKEIDVKSSMLSGVELF